MCGTTDSGTTPSFTSLQTTAEMDPPETRHQPQGLALRQMVILGRTYGLRLTDRTVGTGPPYDRTEWDPVRLFVVSDTHGDQTCLSAGLSRAQTCPVHALAHLGDMGSDGWPDPCPGSTADGSRGNTDPAGRRLPAVRVLDAGGSFSLLARPSPAGEAHVVAEPAARCQADVVLYGHTHRFRLDWVRTADGRAVLLANPGSAFDLDWVPPRVFFCCAQGRTLTNRITGQTESTLEIGSSD